MKRHRIQLSPNRRGDLHSRPPLERMMRMHERLKSGRFPNCRKLAEELEVSAKTVQRDIDFMRYRLGLPIEYDQLLRILGSRKGNDRDEIAPNSSRSAAQLFTQSNSDLR